ncbi:hypothetical protein CIW83_13645 [Tissierella sp. P1]|uniref:BC1881 family protein n=1 Tax=Tissierella sp. P1 TaxID=1280483 RepID=UPI000BA115B8|nr:BC1881 family protein [Tissierella sp. P1]OZV11689.1 hypothetical protein CIW83_13645 [Tissierella sp. P1]
MEDRKNIKNIKDIATKELIEELRNRNGVKELIAEPYDSFKIMVKEQILEETGPAIILVVID